MSSPKQPAGQHRRPDAGAGRAGGALRTGEASGQGDGVKMVCPECSTSYDDDKQVCPTDGSGLIEVPNAPLLTGEVLDERYEMQSVLGAGGMGTVYKAWQPSMEREVAVKVLHPRHTHDPRSVKRFFREAQSASRLVHPNIVTVYDFGRSSSGHLYMVMEHVEGWTIGDLIYHRAPLDPGLAIALAVQICDALSEAHRRRTVHRDLKPDNIQLTTVEGLVVAKVLDFGIARVARDPDEALATNMSTIDICGTPAYMSPEQILGKAPDPRSDLYSLGVILFEMLCGERPFSDDNSVSLCMKQLNELPPRLSRLRSGEPLSVELDDVDEQLLMKEVADRPKTATELRKLLLACPESRGPIDVQALVGDGMAAGLSNMATRPDASVLMQLPTLDAQEETGAAALGSVGGRLADVVARVSADAALRHRCAVCGAFAGEGGGVCDRCGSQPTPPGRSAEGFGDSWARDIKRPSRPASVVGHLLAPNPDVLRSAAVGRWTARREADGWAVSSAAGALHIRAFERDAGRAASQLAVALEELLRGPNAQDLRAGVAVVRDGDEAGAIDVARRLAAAAPRRAIGVQRRLCAELGRMGRPITGVRLPNGQALECAALLAERSSRGVETEAVAAGGAVGPRLEGRSLTFRRLSGLVSEATRCGPVRVMLAGGHGAGKTAVLRALVAETPHLWVTCTPGAEAWPAWGLAQLVRAALGLSRASDDAAVAERLDGLPLRQRDVLALLLLDERVPGGGRLDELAAIVVDVLDRRAAGEPLVIAVDDAHLLDAPSALILARVAEVAAGRPWTFIASGRPEMVLFDDPRRPVHRLELRPLGLRAATGILRSLGVPTAQHGALHALAEGNPLALRLLAAHRLSCPRDLMPEPGQVMTTLLPPVLSGASDAEIEAAWLAAAAGSEGAQPTDAERAARLYLDVGPTPALRAWLAGRLRGAGGDASRLVAFWEPPAESHVAWRGGRCEALGLWRHAEEAYRAAADLAAAPRASDLQLRAAGMQARAGDIAGASAQLEETLRSDAKAPSTPTPLITLGAVLLEAGEDERAEEVLEIAARRFAGRLSPAAAGELAALSARCETRRNDPVRATAHLDRARRVVDSLRATDARAARALESLVQEVRAEVALAQGDAAAARVNLAQARDAFRDLGRHGDAVRCLLQLGRLELDAGSAQRAEDTFRAALTVAAKAGLAPQVERAQVGLGQAQIAAGELEDGARALRGVMRTADASTSVYAEAAIGLARAMLARGLVPDAMRYAERARSAARGQATQARAAIVLAEVLDAEGNGRKARRCLGGASDLARRAGQGVLRQRAQDHLAAL